MSFVVEAPMPGKIVKILVKEGDEVLEYQEVLVLEAMKMENAIPSKKGGTVEEIRVKAGDNVAAKQPLMVIA